MLVVMNTMILTEVNCMFPFRSGLSLSSTSSSFSKRLHRSNRSFRLNVPLEILSFVKLMFIFPDLNKSHVYIQRALMNCNCVYTKILR